MSRHREIIKLTNCVIVLFSRFRSMRVVLIYKNGDSPKVASVVKRVSSVTRPGIAMVSVRGKTAIVTGGASGMGYEQGLHLLANGAKCIAILDLPSSKGEESAMKLNKDFGAGRAFFFPSDVTKHEEFEGVFKKAVEALQGLDILINNAGIFNENMWKKEIEVNFMAVVKNTLLAYEIMDIQKGGKGGIIINMSSILGLSYEQTAPVYTGTKHAVIGYTVSMKEAFEKAGITARILCPGATNTSLFRLTVDKFPPFVNKEYIKEVLMNVPMQSPAHVGKSLIEIIEKGENCSVWLIMNNRPPAEVQLAQYDQIKYYD